MNIIDIYNPYLKAIAWSSDKDDFIKASVAGDYFTVTLRGKTLALPTEKHLRNPNKEKTVFHPLYENVVAKTNPLLDMIRLAMVTRINTIATVVLKALVKIAGNQALHKELNPDQCEFLKLVPEVHKETVLLFDSFIDNIPLNVSNQGIVSVFVKTGGMHKAMKYSKVAVVTFPLYEDINAEKPEVAKFKARDKKTFNAILEYIFPNIAEKAHYSYASNNETSPYNSALFGAYNNLAEALNKVVKLFGDKFEHMDELIIDTEIMELFKDLNAVRNIIHSVPIQDDGVVQSQPVAEAMMAPEPVTQQKPLSALAQKIEDAKKAQTVPSTTVNMVGTGINQPIIQAPVRPGTQTANISDLMRMNNQQGFQQPIMQPQVMMNNQMGGQRMNGWGPAPGQIQNVMPNMMQQQPSWLNANSAYFEAENRQAAMQNGFAFNGRSPL